jgi:hypothetical protein
MLATSGLNSLAPSAPVRLHSAVDRVSDATTSFELASRVLFTRVALRLLERVTRDASDRLLLPITRLRAPASRGFLIGSQVSLCRQGKWRFTTSLPLRRVPRCIRRREILSPCRRRRRTVASDTPVASPSEKRWRFRTHRFVRGRQDRLRHAFVKRTRLYDPECLPSMSDSVPCSAAPTHYRRRRVTDFAFSRSRGFATAIRFSMLLRALPPLAPASC